MVGLAAADGQSLAHKGWAGNGIAVAPWWQGAVFAEVTAGALPGANASEDGERQLGEKLDGLREMGVDALVLGGVDSGDAGAFDRLIGEATRRGLRVVVDLPVRGEQGGSELATGARFWLSRGAAGLRLVRAGGDAAEDQSTEAKARVAGDRFREVERVVAESSGQRVLIRDVPGMALKDATPVRTRRHPKRKMPVMTAEPAGGAFVDHWMQGWTALDAGGLRRVLAAESARVERGHGALGAARLIDGADAQEVLDGHTGDMAAERRVAAAMMLGSEAPLLAAGMEGDGELAQWYRGLSGIRHGNAAVREGRMNLLDAGDQDVVAWVRVARAGGVVSPAVLVVENFSDRPVVLRLGAQLRLAGVPVGSGNVLTMGAGADGRNDAAAMRVDGLTVAAGEVFVGAVEGAPGLEGAAEPVHKRRR